MRFVFSNMTSLQRVLVGAQVPDSSIAPNPIPQETLDGGLFITSMPRDRIMDTPDYAAWRGSWALTWTLSVLMYRAIDAEQKKTIGMSHQEAAKLFSPTRVEEICKPAVEKFQRMFAKAEDEGRLICTFRNAKFQDHWTAFIELLRRQGIKVDRNIPGCEDCFTNSRNLFFNHVTVPAFLNLQRLTDKIALYY